MNCLSCHVSLRHVSRRQTGSAVSTRLMRGKSKAVPKSKQWNRTTAARFNGSRYRAGGGAGGVHVELPTCSASPYLPYGPCTLERNRAGLPRGGRPKGCRPRDSKPSPHGRELKKDMSVAKCRKAYRYWLHSERAPPEGSNGAWLARSQLLPACARRYAAL